MSVLEIILYACLGTGTLAYVIYCIVKCVKNSKKKKETGEQKNDRT